ncbi:MAG: cadmium-translocating P-type ATPase [Peptococcaceae bacterium]|nr:cadmium-translocating P-type ATPase [Peptococcaceae bacterium]
MKKELLLEGLSCAGCAAQIEKDVNKLNGVTASLNFVTKTLSLNIDTGIHKDIDSPVNIKSLLTQTETIIQSIEPGVVTVIKEPGRIQASASLQGRALPRSSVRRILDHHGEKICLVLGSLSFASGVFLGLPAPWPLMCFLFSYLMIGGKVLRQAGATIARGRIFDENFLMSIATLGALAIGEYPEAVAVMLFYRIGALLQDMAVNRSRRSISALMEIRPDSATVKIGDAYKVVSPEQVSIGDVIVVKPGERIPLDGRIITGHAALDVSALTGESLPREVSVGDDVLSGSINSNGALTIKVTKAFSESTLTQILDLVENAGHKKAAAENFITKFARYYTPFVVAVAAGLALIPPLIIPGALFADWIYRALGFLVVACPCALVISIPLSFFAGIGAASRKGILVKGSNYLEALNSVRTVVFDKTGTLTEGVFRVTQVESAEGFTKQDILRYAAHAEWFSNHPIALSIQKAYPGNIDKETLTEYQEIPGHGARVLLKGQVLLAGNRHLMKRYDIPFTPSTALGSLVYVAVDGIYAGSIVISDGVRKDSCRAVAQLRAGGIYTTMLTGDSRAVAEEVAAKTGVSSVFAELLPQEKVERLEKLRSSSQGKGSKLAFVGDGINDAPALAISDVGIAMGGLGSDAAIEAADIVLMTDEVSKVPEAIRIARKTRAVVWQNIVFALGIKAVILILVAMGIAGIWQAVFGDVGVALIAIVNAMRCMR